ncbi:hypothetical protein NIES39_Q00330 [Arthrospira platensis NIES-39]|nr:hypothetical protein NIES39_Q00330 [Arthrospira platensis NIES-39]
MIFDKISTCHLTKPSTLVSIDLVEQSINPLGSTDSAQLSIQPHHALDVE